MMKERILLKKIRNISTKQTFIYLSQIVALGRHLQATDYVVSTAEVMQGSTKYAE
jgi:hypothetical protein